MEIKKYCPIIKGKCILEKCEGCEIYSMKTCKLFEENDDFKKCPTNKYEFKLFGKVLFSYTSSSHPFFPGNAKKCKDCKYRLRHKFYFCNFANGKLIKEEIVDYYD